MAQENLGGLYIEIDLDTQKLISGVRQANQGLDRVSDGFDKTTKSVKEAEGAMFSFSKVAQTVAGALTAGAVIKAVDDWGQMAARIKMSLNSVEGEITRYEEIQNRFLEVSNRNGKAIETTQALYAGSATSMKELGYNTNQTVDYIESLSSTFTANAASAMQTESAMNALNRAMVSGKLSGNDWHSVLNAIPSSVSDVAKELSRLRGGVAVTENEVKQMAMNGGISMKLFADAMINAKDANNELADSMDNTIADGFTKLTNSAKAYYGELNQSYGVTRTAAAGFAVLSSNFDKVATAANIAALVVGARMAGAFAEATKAKITGIASSAKQAKANAAVAKSAEYAANAAKRKAMADKEAALSSQALAQAEYNVAKGSNAEMVALNNLVAAKTRSTEASIALTLAERAQSVASVQAAAAARAASVSFGLAKSALSLIGGPAGAAMLAASAIFYFWQKSQQAKQEALAFADSLDTLNESMKSMSNTQLRGSIADAQESIRAQADEIKSLESEVFELQRRYSSFTDESRAVATAHGSLTSYAEAQEEVYIELGKKTRDLANARDKLTNTEEAASEMSRRLNNSMLASMGVHDQLIEKGTSLERVQGAVAKAFGNTADEINRANQAGQKYSPSSLQVSPATEDGDKYIANLEEQNKLLGIKDERLRAVTKAELDEQKVTDNPNQISAAGRLAGKNFDLQKAEENRRKAQQESESQDKRSAASADSVAQKLESLRRQSELAADSVNELSRAQAIQRAKDSIGKSADPEDIKQAGEYAAIAWDTANALKAQAAAEKLIPEKQEQTRYSQESKDLKVALTGNKITRDEYNAAVERAEQQHQANLAQIRSDAVVSPVAESRGQIDPIQALANENAQKLKLMQEYQAQEQAILKQSYDAGYLTYQQFTDAKAATDSQYLMLKTAQDKQYQEQQTAAQWQLLSQQGLGYDMLTNAVDAFAGNASNALTGLLTGSMSVEDAMRSLGSTMLNSVVNSLVQVGVEALKNFIITETIGKAGQASAAAAAVAGGSAALAAWTPAAIAASIATGGTASATGLTAYQTAQAGGLAMSVLGARKNGGPVSANSLYRVGEGGAPEIYQASTGKQYMIQGDRGKVISNKEMQGGGGINVSINVQNTNGSFFDAQASSDGKGGVTVDMIIADIQSGGQISNSITNNFNVKRRAYGQ